MQAYSVVICTRNRPDALALCLAHLARQTVKPAQVIVVDSSDDPGKTYDAMKWFFPHTYRHTRPGLTYQRNMGLELVTEPIVLFPDDDSILYPDCAQRILAAYDDPAVSAVCAHESPDAPVGFSPGYALRKVWHDKLRTRLGNLRRRVESVVFPNPVNVMGGQSVSESAHPFAVETMTGFRMSFRTSAIRAVGFDEMLSPFAAQEDRDASLGVWQHGVVVSAPGALIYHHRAPEHRANGRKLGVCNLLNLAYVTAKHAKTERVKRLARRFVRYQTALYALAAIRGAHERARFWGAWDALAGCDELLISTQPARLHGEWVKRLLG